MIEKTDVGGWEPASWLLRSWECLRLCDVGISLLTAAAGSALFVEAGDRPSQTIRCTFDGRARTTFLRDFHSCRLTIDTYVRTGGV